MRYIGVALQRQLEKVMQEAWDVSFAAGHTGRALIRAVCADKLTGAHEFTTEELQHLLLLGRPSTAVRPTAPRTGARPPDCEVPSPAMIGRSPSGSRTARLSLRVRHVDQHQVHGPAAKPVLGLRRRPRAFIPLISNLVIGVNSTISVIVLLSLPIRSGRVPTALLAVLSHAIVARLGKGSFRSFACTAKRALQSKKYYTNERMRR